MLTDRMGLARHRGLSCRVLLLIFLQGILTDNYNEFVVVAGPGANDGDRRDNSTWINRFELRQGGADSTPKLCGDFLYDADSTPRFLHPVLNQILVAGKTVWLLKDISDRDDHPLSGLSVYQQVMDAIEKVVPPGEAGSGGDAAIPGSPSGSMHETAPTRRHLFTSEEDFLQHSAIDEAFDWDNTPLAEDPILAPQPESETAVAGTWVLTVARLPRTVLPQY